MEELKWNRMKIKQPNIGQKVIYRNLAENNDVYPIEYGTYYGIENRELVLSPHKLYSCYKFKMWFDSNFCLYGINSSDIIWIPYPLED